MLATNNNNSTNDDAALRNKVDEAIRVYNEYVTQKPEDGAAPTNGENAAPAGEETAAKAE